MDNLLQRLDLSVDVPAVNIKICRDVSLDEFTDAIEPWIIEELKKIGFQTAREVLGAQREMIIQNADLEEETVDEVLRVLQAEFE